MSGQEPLPAAGDEARDPLDLLSEQFLLQVRGGGSQDVEAFAGAHPEHAAGLRELLPTLLMLERAKRERESTASGRSRAHVPLLERLGDFRILREIGRGGMGVVFEAVQESLSRRVALKVLPRGSLLTGNQLARFQREAQTAAQLHHSNIVPVFGSGESDGYHWYAMQFIDGHGLDHWLAQARQGPALAGPAAWSERTRFCARVGVQVGGALAHAHAHGTLHRDIKPANLLLDGDGTVWVTDFGLAKALEQEGSLTHSGDVLGTLQYMAPEQFAGLYDVRSEVYALGLTLWELLTQRPAFAGQSRSELIDQICRGRPERLRRLCPWVPRDLETIVEKCIAHEPRDRFADPLALQADLQAFLDGRPIAARRQSVVEQLWRWCRRNKAVAGLTLATAAAVVLAAVVGWTFYVIADDARGTAQAAAAAARAAQSQTERNLQLTMAAFEDVFDSLVGRDPTHVLEDEDPDTGEASLVVATVLEPGDVALLQRMLAFYDKFAEQNADNQDLRYETARAWRRVGAIQARLGDLDQADAAWQQAVARLADVGDRDVTRDLAGIEIDLAQNQMRRDRVGEAIDRLRRAIKLLEEHLADSSKGMKYDRARAHYLLARAYALGERFGGPGGPGRAGGDRRPGGRPDDRRGDPRRRGDVRAEIEKAQEPLAELLAADPGNAEFLALSARCLLLMPPGVGEGGSRLREQGLQILRDLVQKDPNADRFRFELCNELMRVPRIRPGPGGGPARIDPLVTREALLHAQKLVAQQPAIDEYQAILGRALAAHGEVLLRQADAGQQAEGELHLRQALERLAPLCDGTPLDPRITRELGLATIRLARRLLATDRRQEARALLEPLLLRVRSQHEGRGRMFLGGDPGMLAEVARELGLELPTLPGPESGPRRR